MGKRTLVGNGFVFLLGLILAFSLPGLGKAQTDVSGVDNPVEYVLEDFQGNDVEVLEEGSHNWERAEEGQVLEFGDEIKVGSGCEATLMLQSSTSIHLTGPSDLKVDQIEANDNGGFFSRLKVIAGLVLSDVKKNLGESQSTFEVDSNGVVCGVRGTAFEINAQGDGTQILTHEGTVEVRNGNETRMVTSGNMSAFKAGRFQMQRRLDRNEIQRFQKWRSFRQRVMAKRENRLEAIKNHLRKPWHRRHPHAKKKINRRKIRTLRNHPI